tara:strand:- start:12959 stop:13825 length:867 start_codon:yes stop_codon:yes gene_type:complete
MANRLVIILFFLTSFIAAQDMSRTEYIFKYKDLAVAEMNQYGIPASITLSQGVLESGNGNSELARKAKNHFGIKCHSSWEGKKVYHDDDEAQECFRKYPTVAASYRDHSVFLQKARYANLFELAITDYKGWAKGLKKAGYATNPEYPELLIKIIENNQLQQYDKPTDATFMAKYWYHGMVYGYPYVLGQKGLYKNEHKGFMLTASAEASLEDMHLLIGASKLLHHQIGMGLLSGVSLDKEEAISYQVKYGLAVHFLVPHKEKIWLIQPSVITADFKGFVPAISIGLLK